MEPNVWMQWFVQAATFVSNLFASSNAQSIVPNGGALPNVPASDAPSTSTSKNVTILVVTRDQETAEGLFGRITIKPDPTVICYSMENKARAILSGSYDVHLEYSPHFDMQTPHIVVPSRTYIEIHPANYPMQLLGCVAVGTTRDNVSLGNSKEAFCKLMALLPSHFTIEIIGI